MAAVVTKSNLSRDELKEIVEGLEFDYFLAQDPDIYCLAGIDHFDFAYLEEKIRHRKRSNLDSLYKLKRVRLFNSEYQLEWRQEVKGSYQLVLIANDSAMLDEVESLADGERNSLELEDGPKEIYLWGELDYDYYQEGKSIFYEKQIPKLLDYPLDIAQLGNVASDAEIRAVIEFKQYKVVAEDVDARLEHYLRVSSK